MVVAVFVLVLAVGGRGNGSGRAEGRSALDGVSAGWRGATSGVEVPDVVGATVSEASVVIDAAGLTLVTEGEEIAEDGARVVVQRPAAGAVVASGVQVVVGVAAESRAKDASRPLEGKVVVIDPGHQRRSDMVAEPIGPGATETKPRATGGTTGVVTELPEYEVALQISTNLAARLESAGAKVVLTRTTNDVDLSNSERATVANKAEADVFVRVHGDGSPESEAAGISTLYPERTKWTSGIAGESRRLAQSLQEHAVKTTGATDNGIASRANLSGFNFSEVPVALIECGFLTNPVEDRLLASPHYQDKLAEGIAQGIEAYLIED